jgi:hypothetical protein
MTTANPDQAVGQSHPNPQQHLNETNFLQNAKMENLHDARVADLPPPAQFELMSSCPALASLSSTCESS